MVEMCGEAQFLIFFKISKFSEFSCRKILLGSEEKIFRDFIFPEESENANFWICPNLRLIPKILEF